MSSDQDPQPAPAADRRAAFAAWRRRQTERARAGAAWAGRKLRPARERIATAPWKQIGLWTGGVVGGLLAIFVLFVTFADWNALKGPISRFASAASGREIVIQGDLDVDPFSFTPEIRVEGLRIGNPAQFRERGTFAEIGQAEAAVRLFPLFIGRLDVVRLDLDRADIRLYRSAEGVSNWAPQRASRGKPFQLPAIRRFSVNGGRVLLEDDKRRMTLDATFTSQEDMERGGQFVLSGDGSLNNRPFRLELTGAPLLNVRRDRPYAFEGDVRMGSTRIVADGAIRRPFDLSAFTADVTANGPDLADLYYLLGLALPNTPPYRLTGKVERAGSRYSMTGLNGRVGDSDLAGQFTVTRPNDRPFFDGDFTSRSLDFDDLMAVLGGSPDTDETASPEQRAEAARLEAQGRLFPDARLDISRVRNMDARVSYRAARVVAPRLPLRSFATTISLDQGLLRLDPLTLGLNQGRIGGALSINARQETPRVDLDVRLADARIESILMRGETPAATGALHGRARLSGSGAAVREAAANANGTVSFVIPQGEVREAFAELTGINVVRGLGLLLSEDQSKIDIRCGVATFDVRNGIGTAQTLVVDTQTMLITGGGTVNLRNETLDLQVEGAPKEPRLISVAAPINVTGRFRSPQVGVEAGSAIAQGGISALLATIAAPLAAVLPFIDAGLAEDANCSALMAEGRAAPTPERGR